MTNQPCMVFKPDLSAPLKLILTQIAPKRLATEVIKHLGFTQQQQQQKNLCLIDTNLAIINKLDWYLTVPQH